MELLYKTKNKGSFPNIERKVGGMEELTMDFSPSTPPTPDYSPGEYGAPSAGDWDSDYDMDQD